MVRTWPRISSVTKFCFRHFSSGFFDLVQWWRLLQIKELLYYNWARDCAHATVSEIWCVEEVGDHHGQEANKWTFGSGLLYARSSGGGAKKWRGNEEAWVEKSLVIVIFIVHVLTVNTRTVTKSTLSGGWKQDEYCVCVSTLWRCGWIWKAHEKNGGNSYLRWVSSVAALGCDP